MTRKKGPDYGQPVEGACRLRRLGAIAGELNEYGGALLPRLLTREETEQIRSLYDEDPHFRGTINMGRHRFGEGEYRYFKTPYPKPIEELKQALYPRLLPIARDWWGKLGRPALWPDTLDESLLMCHDAGQTKSSAILLRYVEKDWNALHRDLYGDLVFPLQVVINLSEPWVDHTGGEFLLLEQRPRAQSRGTATLLPLGHGYLFTTRDRPCNPPGDGRLRPSGTESRRSAPGSATRSPWSSTMPHEQHRQDIYPHERQR